MHLNRWLVDNGYLVLQDGKSESDVVFSSVDWSRSRAYALGLNGLFINTAGRESRGIVEPADVPELKNELRAALTDWTDDQSGDPVIRRVFDGLVIYPSSQDNDETPDLVIGYHRGYRASWQTTLGAVPEPLMEPNRQKWSGDHCIDPQLVPGVLFRNVQARARSDFDSGYIVAGADPDSMTSRGLLDWPGVVLGAINQPLVAVLPEPVVLAFWALVSSWLTMWVYRRFSNQAEMAALKPQIKAVQKKLSNYDGEFSGLIPLIRENFSLAGRQLALALGPALLAGVPVLFVLVWVSNAFGVKMPAAGADMEVRAVAAESADVSSWQWHGTPEPVRQTMMPGHAWRLSWPGAGTSATLITARGEDVVEIPPAHPAPVVHKRQWWNTLIGNPAGYLEPITPAEAVYLDLPKKQMLPFGPGWMRGWEFLYFVLLIVGSLALKLIWRIH